MKKRLRILILRHGMTKGNSEKRYIGKRSQEPLSKEGERFLRENASGYPSSMYLFVSPSLRAVNTARIIYPRLFSRRIVIPVFDEMDFGIFEGKNYKDLSDNAAYRQWVDGGCLGMIPGGEDMESFKERVREGFSIVIDTIEKEHKELSLIHITEAEDFSPKRRLSEVTDAVIVAHGGTIMALLSSFLDQDYFSFDAACGEGYILTVTVD